MGVKSGKKKLQKGLKKKRNAIKIREKTAKQNKKAVLVLKKRRGIVIAPQTEPLAIAIIEFGGAGGNDIRKQIVKITEAGGNADNVDYDDRLIYRVLPTLLQSSARGTASKINRISVTIVPRDDIFQVVDTCLASNFILAVFTDDRGELSMPKEEAMQDDDQENDEKYSFEYSAFDRRGYELLSVVKSQGVKNIAGILRVTNPEEPQKRKHQKYKLVKRFFQSEFGKDKKFFTTGEPGAVQKTIRHIASTTNLRSQAQMDRAYIFPDSCQSSAIPGSDSLVNIAFTGYCRGLGFNTGMIAHLSGYGDFLISKISPCKDPCVPNGINTPTDFAIDVLSPEERQSLTHDMQNTLLPYNPLEDEQAEITEEELREAQIQSDECRMDEDKSSGGPEPDFDFALPDYEEDPEEIKRTRAQLKSQFEMESRGEGDMDVPDEKDTPTDRLALERFAKYRSLSSLKNSPWDPLESLPKDYQRIYAFESFAGNAHTALVSQAERSKATKGRYCAIFLENVPVACVQDLPDKQKSDGTFNLKKSIVISSLAPLEMKTSVCHFPIQRHMHCEDEIKAKHECIFQVGFRRLKFSPIFSQAIGSLSLNSCRADPAHNRLLAIKKVPEDSREEIVATAFSPVCVTSTAPVLVFRPEDSKLLAVGSSAPPDPKIVIVKRIVLTGYPYRVNKRKASVRYMFFTQRDIRYFKPAELRSRKGLKGSIVEPLGTHGYMKCMFNQPIRQDDIVCMNLYKRIFPKLPANV